MSAKNKTAAAWDALLGALDELATEQGDRSALCVKLRGLSVLAHSLREKHIDEAPLARRCATVLCLVETRMTEHPTVLYDPLGVRNLVGWIRDGREHRTTDEVAQNRSEMFCAAVTRAGMLSTCCLNMSADQHTDEPAQDAP